MSLFLQNHNKTETEIFAFCVITFEPICIYACLVPQNDHLILSFTVGKKLTKIGLKTATYLAIENFVNHPLPINSLCKTIKREKNAESLIFIHGWNF